MYDPMVRFIHHKNHVWYHNPTQKIPTSLANLNVKNIFFSEKLLKYYDIFKKSWVKKGSKLNNAYYSNEIW